MDHNLAHSMALLGRTPRTLDALLRELPEEWTLHNEGENTWTVFDVVGHLIYGEGTDWLPRAKIILQFGESKPFDPFDRAGHIAESRGKTLPQLLDDFARARAQTLSELRAMDLKPEQLQLRGRHPSLGVVTLSQLLATWGVHDLTHLHQISRIMAYQDREAVGPWSAYMGVLHCAGHSS